jgi:hypothetical protein
MIQAPRVIAFALLVLGIGACSSTYKPVALDPGTGLYNTLTSVPPGGVAVTEPKIKLDENGVVLLVADSNRYPSRLEFVTRKALADLGYRNVVNVRELRSWADDTKFNFAPDRISIEALKDFSANVRPVLIVDVRYGWLGEVQHYGGLRIIDGRDGTPLLTVSHPRHVWVSVDEEVIYPVLNELRKWHRSVFAKGT